MAAGGGGGSKKGGSSGSSGGGRDGGIRDNAGADRGAPGNSGGNGGRRDTSGAQGGGLGRSRGGITGDSETAKKNREKTGAQDPTARDGRPSDSTKTDSMLDSILGYDTYGERRQAYKNNPNRAGGRNLPPVAMVPSFPQARPGIIAAAALDALGSISPLGFAGLMGRVGMSAVTGNEFSTGLAMDAAKEMGASLGPQGPDVGVGVDRGGSAVGGGHSGNAGGLATGGLSSTRPNTTAAPAPAEGTPVPGAPADSTPVGRRWKALGVPASIGPTFNSLF